MEAAVARSILGVGAGAGDVELRAAYRAALRRTHPDLHGGGGNTTRRVVDAYRALVAEAPPTAPPSASPAPIPADTAVIVEGDTVAAELPAGDLFAMLQEVGDRVGDVTYADSGAGLLEIVVDVAGHGACSVVLSLQGRGTGVTEAFCTVEPLGSGPVPPASVIAEILAAGLRSLVR